MFDIRRNAPLLKEQQFGVRITAQNNSVTHLYHVFFNNKDINVDASTSLTFLGDDLFTLRVGFGFLGVSLSKDM